VVTCGDEAEGVPLTYFVITEGTFDQTKGAPKTCRASAHLRGP
jgi:hypothetical protein